MEKRNALLNEIHHRQAVVRLKSDASSQTDNDTLSFVMVSENNGGMRYDWWSGESYLEELSIEGGSFGNLNTFFKDHDRSVDSAVGRIENVRVEGSTIVADVKFGSGEDEQSIFRKYNEGILTDVSIGYQINKYEVEERDGEPDVVTVTDYEIFELSAVGIGFDKGAKKRESMLEDDEELEARISALEAHYGINNK